MAVAEYQNLNCWHCWCRYKISRQTRPGHGRVPLVSSSYAFCSRLTGHSVRFGACAPLWRFPGFLLSRFVANRRLCCAWIGLRIQNSCRATAPTTKSCKPCHRGICSWNALPHSHSIVDSLSSVVIGTLTVALRLLPSMTLLNEILTGTLGAVFWDSPSWAFGTEHVVLPLTAIDCKCPA